MTKSTRPAAVRRPPAASANGTLVRRVGSVLALIAIVAAIPLVRQYKAAHAPMAEAVDVDEGTAADRAAKRAALARDLAGLNPQTPEKRTSHGVDVGGFEATFATRSPLSAPATLERRLRTPTPVDDYDLKSIGFLAYVPPTYDPARPMGLIVLGNYKPTQGLPQPIFPQLDAANVAFVVAKPLAQPWTTRAGLMLDAVANMRSRYAIDPRRVYLLASNEPKDPDGAYRFTGERVGLTFPEAFSGLICVNFGIYRPVRAADGGSWHASFPRLDVDVFEKVRHHPLVLATMQTSDASERFAAAFQADGFQHVLYRTITVDQFHYPNYTGDWLPETLKFLDDVTTATTEPATTTP